MKYFKICLFFIFISVQASQYSGLPDIAFKKSLRAYDPAKDVGLQQYGQNYAFGHYTPRKPISLKNSENRRDCLLHQQRLQEYEKPKPFVPSLRLRWSEVIAQRKK